MRGCNPPLLNAQVDGALRIRFEKGWVSMVTAKGNMMLELVDEETNEKNLVVVDANAEEESEAEAEPAPEADGEAEQHEDEQEDSGSDTASESASTEEEEEAEDRDPMMDKIEDALDPSFHDLRVRADIIGHARINM